MLGVDIKKTKAMGRTGFPQLCISTLVESSVTHFLNISQFSYNVRRAIQGELSKTLRKSDNKMKSFGNLVLQGRLSAAGKVLSQRDAIESKDGLVTSDWSRWKP